MFELNPEEVRLLLFFRALLDHHRVATLNFVAELAQLGGADVVIDHVKPESRLHTRH